MYKQLLPLSITLLLFIFAAHLQQTYQLIPAPPANHFPVESPLFQDKHHQPADQFFMQRTRPGQAFALAAYRSAMRQAQHDYKHKQASNRGGAFDQIWATEGPDNISGRINCIAAHPLNADTLFVGAASGGIFRSNDRGQSWFPVFDEQPFLAIGDITFDPQNPSVIYAGTGDPNVSGFPFIGDGVYKSEDGGQSWQNIGLSQTYITSKIIVHPSNSDVIYAGTMGLPFVRNNDRGLYKSTDGGQSWQQILFVSDDAGIIDLVMDPNDPNILYAASWDRIRNNHESIVTGPNAKIWKTTDGGSNWTDISPNTNGIATGDHSRIGLEISTNPERLYFSYTASNQLLGGIEYSDDGGLTWTEMDVSNIEDVTGGFGWYFGKIRENPFTTQEISVLGVTNYRSTDGINWQEEAEWGDGVHADKHDMLFLSASEVLLATDGGMYRSTDGGFNWNPMGNIFNTQFYRVEVIPHSSGTYAGGMQDNGTVFQLNGSGWVRVCGGDGFQPRFDVNDPNVFYCEIQNGFLRYSIDGGQNIEDHTNGIDFNDRINWDMPFMISETDPNRQYVGTQYVYRNVNGPGGFWQPISPDLTDGVIFHPRYHNITTVNESPLDSDVIYAGTVDANVWVTQDGGANWSNITQNLPDQYVSSVKPSPTVASHAFVSHSGYKENDFLPHIHKTTDYGQSWINISGDLPNLAINDLIVHPSNEDILFVATDGGVYGSMDGGNDWERLGTNMPVVPVYDMAFDLPNQKLIAGTHGRAMMSYPLDSLLLSTSIESNLQAPLRLYPNPSSDYIQVEWPEQLPPQAQLVIYAINGQEVMRQKAVNQAIDVRGFQAGAYVLEIQANEMKWQGKFVVSR